MVRQKGSIQSWINTSGGTLITNKTTGQKSCQWPNSHTTILSWPQPVLHPFLPSMDNTHDGLSNKILRLMHLHPAVLKQWANQFENLNTYLTSEMVNAQATQSEQPDKGRLPAPAYKIGDEVWLLHQHIQTTCCGGANDGRTPSLGCIQELRRKVVYCLDVVVCTQEKRRERRGESRKRRIERKSRIGGIGAGEVELYRRVL